MTVTRDIFTGLVGMITTAGLAVFHPTTAYASTDTAIYPKTLPDGTGVPDKAIAINIVPFTDNVTLPAGLTMVQIVGRGARNDPLSVDDILDPIFDILHGATRLTWGQTGVIQILRNSSIPFPEDANHRTERVDKYYLDLDYPPTSLRPDGGSWT